MKATFTKHGKGVAIRIPLSVVRAAGMKLDEAVQVNAVSGQIIIQSDETPFYNLDELVKRITPRNRHKLIDFGPAVGKEVL
jgi:antitoxin MazE